MGPGWGPRRGHARTASARPVQQAQQPPVHARRSSLQAAPGLTVGVAQLGHEQGLLLEVAQRQLLLHGLRHEVALHLGKNLDGHQRAAILSQPHLRQWRRRGGLRRWAAAEGGGSSSTASSSRQGRTVAAAPPPHLAKRPLAHALDQADVGRRDCGRAAGAWQQARAWAGVEQRQAADQRASCEAAAPCHVPHATSRPGPPSAPSRKPGGSFVRSVMASVLMPPAAAPPWMTWNPARRRLRLSSLSWLDSEAMLWPIRSCGHRGELGGGGRHQRQAAEKAASHRNAPASGTAASAPALTHALLEQCGLLALPPPLLLPPPRPRHPRCPPRRHRAAPPPGHPPPHRRCRRHSASFPKRWRRHLLLLLLLLLLLRWHPSQAPQPPAACAGAAASGAASAGTTQPAAAARRPRRSR